MDPNSLSRCSFSLTFGDGAQAVLQSSCAGSASFEMRVRLDGVSRFFPGEHGTTWRAKGWWESLSDVVVLLESS
jgi:hypothetical protein